MASYDVVWRIEVEAESAEEAAKIAQEMQRDPRSLATVFEVRGPWRDTYDVIDLAE